MITTQRLDALITDLMDADDHARSGQLDLARVQTEKVVLGALRMLGVDRKQIERAEVEMNRAALGVGSGSPERWTTFGSLERL